MTIHKKMQTTSLAHVGDLILAFYFVDAFKTLAQPYQCNKETAWRE